MINAMDYIVVQNIFYPFLGVDYTPLSCWHPDLPCDLWYNLIHLISEGVILTALVNDLGTEMHE